MQLSPSALWELARSPEGKKMVRYTIVSVISVAVSQVVYLVLFGGFRESAVTANIIATAAGTLPSYELNRKWAWGKKGKGHLWKEVVPFWSLSFIGLAFSTGSVAVASHDTMHMSHLARTVITDLANLGSWGVLWVGKFIFFNKVLFRTHPQDLEPALDGRTGLPT